VHYLRDDLRLTGTHIGCDTSQCGACTVLFNGNAIKACSLLAVQANGGDILTIEGLARDQHLHPLQQAFWEQHGVQCGYCTSGMILRAYALLQNNPHPDEQDIRHGLHGNLCRCTGYQFIIQAIQSAADVMAQATEDGHQSVDEKLHNVNNLTTKEQSHDTLS
jgi:carbon-monoxide dehydrogenase small subunit